MSARQSHRGMVTSEYAVGTVAAVACVALLIAVIDMRAIFRLSLRFWEWVFHILGWGP